jgi:hypothetical protein
MSDRTFTSYPFGLTSKEETLNGIVCGDFQTTDSIYRIALISGLSRKINSREAHKEALNVFLKAPEEISFIAADLSGTNVSLSESSYPVNDGYFFDKTCPESRYLWRWITMEAPDIVLELNPGSSRSVECYTGGSNDGSLLSALASGEGQTPGSIPGIRITCPAETVGKEVEAVIDKIRSGSPTLSGARCELDRRSARSPLDTARKLGAIYGYKLDEPVNYVQGVAISGRMRLSKLDTAYPDPADSIVKLVEFLTTEAGFAGNDRTGPNLAAMCWTEELLESTGGEIWKHLLLKAANTYSQFENGTAPYPCHPDFGCEDMFFISAMCGRAYKITGDEQYLNTYSNFLLESSTQQNDGLFWHCRSAPYLWGRGNGFAALAFAEGLTYMPEQHSSRDQLIAMHSHHLDGLSRLQQPSGMWTQLLDFPGTYQEMSATCMIGYSMARGLRKGWLDQRFVSVLEKAWEGVNRRISNQGDLVDVCTGTGFQESREDYIYRAAEYGYDDRGGSMAIWFATEMERLQRSISNR